MAQYPNATYSPRTKQNKAGVVYDSAKSTVGYAEDVTKLDNEVVAIENELGTNPKGASADVKTRLVAIESSVPSKATGAEIDTGSNDTKFATPKAIRDSGLLSGAVGGEFNALSDKETPIDDDLFVIEDSVASYAKKKLSYVNLKELLENYLTSFFLLLSGGTMTGELLQGENSAVRLDDVLSADGKYCGIVEAGVAGTTLVFGDLCYFQAADSRWEKADANLSAGYDKKLGMCVQAAANDGSATKMLLIGKIRADSKFPTLTIGSAVYMAETAGDVVVAQPTTADVCIRVVGFGNAAKELYFNPSNDYITHV